MQVENKEVLVNKIATSGLKVIKLEEFAPTHNTFDFDISKYLFKGFLLKEKDFRAEMKSFPWESVKGKIVCVICSTDAIVPKWAYMLITQHAFDDAQDLFFGTKKDLFIARFLKNIEDNDWSIFENERVILKGCSDGLEIPESIYMLATKKLMPFAKSIMYGEPCSTVPVFRKRKKI